MLLKTSKFVVVARGVFHLYHAFKFPHLNTAKLSRIVSNSGCLIAGCCFSRQSDEDSLLPKAKENDGRININIKTNDGGYCYSNIKKDSSFINMKRSSEFLNNAVSPDSDVSEIIAQQPDVLHKRRKVIDEEFEKEADQKIKQLSTEKDPLANSNNECPNEQKKELPEKKELSKRLRPNYFVAVQVSNQEIHKNLKYIQNHILEKEVNLKKSMTELKTLHITLMVMYIGDAETHSRAMTALKSIHQEHDKDMSDNPLELEFKGLGHFQNRVLFAKLSVDDSYKRLCNLAASVKEHFAANNIATTDKRSEFTPHLTVAKIDFKKKQKKFVKKIEPELYKDYIDQYFGSQRIESIQLLSMTNPKNDEGYYSGDEIYFSAFDPDKKINALCEMMEVEKKKKDIKDVIRSLMKEKLK